MPRDGANIYHRPPGTDAVPDTTIESSKYNAYVADIEQDLNLPRPIVAGGTGASSADAALLALGGEKAKQVVTNFDATAWMPGSFYAAVGATSAPVAGHAFSGIVYYANATDLVVEARDLNDANQTVYTRVMSGGVWGAWKADGGAIIAQLGNYVLKAGDTMSGPLVLPADPTLALQSATKQYVDTQAAAAIAAIAARAVRYDVAQALTAAQQVQARQNIAAAPFDAMAHNGLQLNGSMEINQAGIGALATSGYPADGWFFTKGAGITAVVSCAQQATISSGYNNWLQMTVSTAQPSLAAGDDCWIDTRIEGRRFARLRWGYANAQPLTIGFWSLHQRAGVWGGSVRNSAQTRSYAFTYTQAAAGAMQWNVITIPGDTFGGVATWLNDTGPGAIITFGIAVGSTYVAPAANTWYSANYHTPPGCVNGVAATTDVFGIMGFVALPGTEAPASDRAPYIMRPYDQELLLCQRYYQVSFIALEATTPSAGAIISASLPYKTPMRAVPTGTISTSFTSNANTPTFNSMNYYGGYLSALVPAAGRGYWYGIVFLDARI